MISSFQNVLDEHLEIEIREIRAVSVTAVMSKTRKTPYIIIKDFGPRGCHSENTKICINWPEMLEITPKVVLICNSLVSNQISSQNLDIFNIYAENWHFSSKLWLKMAKI